MNKKSGWSVALFVIGSLIIVVLLIGLVLLFINRWGLGFFGMPMRPWGLHRWVYPPFMGWFGPLAMILTLLLLIVFLVLGMIWLMRGASPTNSTPPTSTPLQLHCPQCKRPIRDDWQICPYCGAQLQQASHNP